MKQTNECTNPKRGCVKLAIIFVAALATLAGLIYLFDGLPIDELKHNFSVWTIIGLVVIINLVSFMCFVAMYAAWQWARRDFKTTRPYDDLDI